MPRPKDNVIPFRPRPRKWTRPEDYSPRRFTPPPGPPRRPKTDWRKLRRTLAVWAVIAAAAALGIAWSLWR